MDALIAVNALIAGNALIAVSGSEWPTCSCCRV